MPFDDKSTDSSVTPDKAIKIAMTGGETKVSFELKDTETTISLEDSVRMWHAMTNWLLNMADTLEAQSDGLPVSKNVLNALVQKITHECDVLRAKEAKDKSPIITP
jgi:hypothetical protein